jgi:heme-degrading monooxygenase HmoA
MVGVLVSFDFDGPVDRQRVVGIAEHARTQFEGMPGLRLKVFTVDEERRRATNVYFWDDAEAAAAFFSDELVERVTGLYGVRPRVEFVEVITVVDNTPIATTS